MFFKPLIYHSSRYEFIANSKSFRDVIYTFSGKIFIFSHIFFFPDVLKYIWKYFSLLCLDAYKSYLISDSLNQKFLYLKIH